MVKNIIGKSLVIFSVMMIAWFILSWAEIVAHNLEYNPTYNDYNVFVLITENQK